MLELRNEMDSDPPERVRHPLSLSPVLILSQAPDMEPQCLFSGVAAPIGTWSVCRLNGPELTVGLRSRGWQTGMWVPVFSSVTVSWGISFLKLRFLRGKIIPIYIIVVGNRNKISSIVIGKATFPIIVVVIWDRISLCSFGCPGTHCVDQDDRRDSPASGFWVPGLKACITQLGSFVLPNNVFRTCAGLEKWLKG